MAQIIIAVVPVGAITKIDSSALVGCIVSVAEGLGEGSGSGGCRRGAGGGDAIEEVVVAMGGKNEGTAGAHLDVIDETGVGLVAVGRLAVALGGGFEARGLVVGVALREEGLADGSGRGIATAQAVVVGIEYGTGEDAAVHRDEVELAKGVLIVVEHACGGTGRVHLPKTIVGVADVGCEVRVVDGGDGSGSVVAVAGGDAALPGAGVESTGRGVSERGTFAIGVLLLLESATGGVVVPSGDAAGGAQGFEATLRGVGVIGGVGAGAGDALQLSCGEVIVVDLAAVWQSDDVASTCGIVRVSGDLWVAPGAGEGRGEVTVWRLPSSK